MSIVAKSLKFEKFGPPTEVLKITEETLNPPKGTQVLVKILAAPINPADVIAIRGKYPGTPKFPVVAGNECVAEVVSVGEDVKKLAPGQRVVPYVNGLGTWATHAIYNEDQLLPISNKIGIPEAATITVNPCTAYRMLKDFINLKQGDCVIQNGANSAVGQAVHQLCKVWGIDSVGIVRDRPNIVRLKAQLKELGASQVLTEEELLTTRIFEDNIVNKPRLALNCVGGESANAITRQLANNGVMVTYGAMTNDPIVPTKNDLVYKNITFRGFWRTRWTNENLDSIERKQMFDELLELFENKQLVAPVHEIVPLEKFNDPTVDAFSTNGFAGKKILFGSQ